MRHFNACLRHAQQAVGNDASIQAAAPRRLLSSTASARDEVQTQQPSTPAPPPASAQSSAPAKDGSAPRQTPEYMQKWGELDPAQVEKKRDERRLVRREGVQPIGSRRRRAIMARSAAAKADEIPFEQLPYQCFQEARKFLLEDRKEKLKEIATQTLRIQNLKSQDAAVSGGDAAKESRLRNMQKHLDELVILADINDPLVKKKFEDGEGMCHSFSALGMGPNSFR